MAEEERFDVWQYLKYDDWHDKVGDDLSAEAAVKLAHSYTTRPAARIGFIRAVRIINRSDDTVAFQWEYGKGITFPVLRSSLSPVLPQPISHDGAEGSN